jgi:poly-gamma-glutamate capsule biosynthesis protein CapA/YwtB (metallophosphatase superfamily)
MAAARVLARAGADIVLGAHAHVAQPAELLLLNGFDGGSGCSAAGRAALAALPPAARLDGAPGPPRQALVLYSLGARCACACC